MIILRSIRKRSWVVFNERTGTPGVIFMIAPLTGMPAEAMTHGRVSSHYKSRALSVITTIIYTIKAPSVCPSRYYGSHLQAMFHTSSLVRHIDVALSAAIFVLMFTLTERTIFVNWGAYHVVPSSILSLILFSHVSRGPFHEIVPLKSLW
jgi:hypothetical protein